MGKDKVQWALENKFIEFRKTNKKKSGWAVCYKNYLNVNNENKPVERSAPHKNLIMDVLNANATANIKAIFGGISLFKYSKPVELIKKILKFSNNKNAVILDFFAGSGTTGQAVLELNREDCGNRRFILCTNNENGICKNVTYQRLKTVITGKRVDNSTYSDGIPANLKYYKTDFVAKDSEELSEELLAHIREMIQLEHGVKVDGRQYVMIMTDDEMDGFETHFSEYTDLKAVFVNQDVLFSAEQEKLLRKIQSFVIPDYYFDFELREAGEIW